MAKTFQGLCGKFEYNFVTAAYVFVDMEKNVRVMRVQDIPPLLIWRAASGSASEILENGLVLGQFPAESYTALELSLDAGDRIVLYTDGIPETKSPSDAEFGSGSILRVMADSHTVGSEQFIDALLDELSRWSGHPRGDGQQDDTTVLVIDFKNHS